MIKSITLTVLSIILITLPLEAQDAHYWTQQYGTRSRLLGGTVIAGTDDLGSTYYNPGRLGLTEDPSFLLSAKIYQFIQVTNEDGASDGEDLKDSQFGTAPSLLAGSFRIKKLPGHHFAYSLLTRQNASFSTLTRGASTFDVFPERPGLERLGGEITTNQRLKEEWLGFTWSYAVSPKVSFGVTNYLVSRSQKTVARIILESINFNDNITAGAIRLNEFSYTANGFLWKFGSAFDFSPLTLGFTVTTPRLQLGGSGKRFYNAFNVGGAIDDPGGNFEDLVAGGEEKGIDPTFRSPTFIGFGAGYQLGRFKLHFSAEWASAVDRYTILEPSDFINLIDSTTFRVPIIQDTESVFNYGFGLEVKANDKVSIYGSFTTDQTSAPEEVSGLGSFDEESNASISNWDLLHFSGGVNLTVKQKVNITAGFANGFGSQEVPRAANLPEDEDSGPVFDSDNTSTLSYSRWTFIFGFDFKI